MIISLGVITPEYNFFEVAILEKESQSIITARQLGALYLLDYKSR